MEDEKVPEGQPEEPKTPEGSTVLIDKANEAAERIEKANAQLAKLLARQEVLRVENIVSGKAEAGEPTLVKTHDETAVEHAREFLDGTGYGEKLFPKEAK